MSETESTEKPRELVDEEKVEQTQQESVEIPKSSGDASLESHPTEERKESQQQPEAPKKPEEIQMYGDKFTLLIDPDPSTASLFQLQMTRCVDKTVKLHSLAREADKLIKAEKAAGEAMGKLGVEYGDSDLKILADFASVRTIGAMKLEDGLQQAMSRLKTLNIAIQAAHEADLEHEQAIVSHLKNADTGRVVISRGRAHQTKLEALVACAQLSGFQAEFRNSLGQYVGAISADALIEEVDVQNSIKRANLLNQAVLAALQGAHYTLGPGLNGPPRGWLNFRTRGLPFSQWQRMFFFIQDGHLMRQTKDEISATLFMDFKGAKVESCQVDDRANTFLVTSPSGKYYFQAESFEAGDAWIATIDSLIMAVQGVEQVSPEVAAQLTRGRAGSQSDWVTNITGNLKNAFSSLKTSAAQIADKIDAPLSPPAERQSQTRSPEIDPSIVEEISWDYPEPIEHEPISDGKNIECRLLGIRHCGLEAAEDVAKSIQTARAQFRVPSPPLARLTIKAPALSLSPVNEPEKSTLTNVIKLIPLGGDIAGILVDRDDHAELWLLQGLDLNIRLQEILQ
ncbi:Oidioi.mRNA.OKI2018_I69.chr1.g3538.t1.cds [Oikopleura dioica]|uniref:Oidioi.mRNA.OKI2018_I69.chr1.g3538.t1.cds n=1 Tax=Oikopleura dioica TaxID=34765 RepID=A0ABN7T0Y6_OIKDI|nr:Oidioi.mRNA.OKI2018_I69.chr1.g3538.t1.cds [Oikopleura dioica]